MSLSPASGIGRFYKHSAKIIRFVRLGCTNRPFYHIVVMERRKNQHQPVIEQVGSYDPLPNDFNERLVALNTERIRFWLGKGAHISDPAAELLGVAGLLPIHPRTYMTAWRNRRKLAEEQAEAAAAGQAESASGSA
ncbi:probable 28S ribosomal protein S16, mitochondrial [Drosophila miranda]|uniref:probable 28S ribosomal protein S16, mitochondrial n=1 Tax=Drosophila miranda TaxID=7229 RepID=UPI0007E89A34|nr:probable 28S ribosomal protein S16, mitochondrial [Drosophila miranda]